MPDVPDGYVPKTLAADPSGWVLAAESGGSPPNAEDVPFTPAGTIAATDVQAAIEEVAAEAGGSLPGAWTPYTPALTASVTNPTLGSGSSAVGRYTQIGNLVVVHIDISFGTSGVGAGSGYYIVSVPVTGYDDGVGFSAVAPCGFLQDISTGARRLVSAFWDNTNRNRFGLTTETGNVTNASPWTWAASDQLKLSLFYEAA